MVQMLVHIVSSTVTLPALSLHAKRSPSWFQLTSRHWGHSSRRACTVARPVTDANSSYADLSSKHFAIHNLSLLMPSCNQTFLTITEPVYRPNFNFLVLQYGHVSSVRGERDVPVNLAADKLYQAWRQRAGTWRSTIKYKALYFKLCMTWYDRTRPSKKLSSYCHAIFRLSWRESFRKV